MILKKLNSGFLLIKIGSINTNNVETMLKNLPINASKNFVSFFSLKPISSIVQIESAFFQALREFENNSNTAKSLQLELLLFLSGKKQLSRVIDEMRLSNKDNVVLLGFGLSRESVLKDLNNLGNQLNFKENNSLLSKNLENNFIFLKKFFNVSGNEIVSLREKNKFDGLQKAIIERIALTKIGE